MSGSRKGFTLMEVLIVIVIMSILVVIAATSFLRTNESQVLERSAAEVIAAIDQARSQTISSKGDTSYGVHFDTNSITIFSGSTYSSTNPSNISVELSSSVLLTTNFAGGASSIVFERITGALPDDGSVTISLVDNAQASTTINIYQSGLSQID